MNTAMHYRYIGKDVSDIVCRKNRNTFYVQKLYIRNLAIWEIMWKNIVEQGRSQ